MSSVCWVIWCRLSRSNSTYQSSIYYYYNYYYYFFCHFMALCPELPGWASTRRKHSPTHTYPNHQPSFICFLHLLRSIASSPFNLHAWQTFRTTTLQSSLVYLLVWHPPLHKFLHPITVSFSKHMPIPLQPVVSRLCHLILVSLNSWHETLSFTLMSHIHLTILISARRSATWYSFLTGQVSLPCNILLQNNCCTIIHIS